MCLRAVLLAMILAAAGAGVYAQQVDESLYKGMKWRQIGPFRGGRVLAVAGVPGDAQTFYFGGTGSGIWKTTNGGADWTPLFDKQSVSAIGAIAVAASDPNVIYAGSGEACIRSNISHGDGVYKSTDAGKTWVNVGLKDTRHIGRLIIHPRDPNIVFVAALGHAFGNNAERGVFRTQDGGKTWEKVLYKDDKTGAIDITFDPTNPHILFAALWEASRSPWGLNSGGPGSGLYKSTDSGATWKRLEGNGLPKGILGRIGVSVSGGDGNRVYALIEAEEGGLYRSDDGGDKWTRINEDRNFLQRAWYYTHVFADPKNVDTLYILNVRAHRSTDGGKSFQQIRPPHGDNHGLWIDPTEPQRMILGNDGGATISVDGAKTWTRQDSQPTAQFYHVITDNHFPYNVYGAQQDNSTIGIQSRGEYGVIGRWNWNPVGGGESGYIAPDPRDNGVIYAGGYEGEITRYDRRTGQIQEIGAWPEPSDGEGAAKLKYRFQWTAPIVLSPQDPNVLYHGSQVLLMSNNGGMSWTPISPDLTRNDKSKQVAPGGPITKEDTGAEYYDTIFSIAPSTIEKNLIWVGSDDGLVHITRDGGKNWANVTPKQMPEWGRVDLIEASPHDPATAYMAVERHMLDDYHPYLFKTSNYGKSWSPLTAGIPDGTFVRAVREDPKRKGLLYAGTETGIYVSFNDGAQWQPLQLNLPTTPIHDLVIKDDDLVVATHGRSFWILDDIALLRQVNANLVKGTAYFYTPAATYRGPFGGGFPIHGPLGQNPPYGVVFDYYLKAAPAEKEDVTLEIVDGQGKSIRKISSLKKPDASPDADDEDESDAKLPVEAGMNRYVWDMRYEPVAHIPGYSTGEYGDGLKGPLVLPGAYTARLTVGGKPLEVPFEVKLDPRNTASQADLQKQFDLRVKIHDRLAEDYSTVNQLRDLRVQLKGIEKRLQNDAAHKEVLSAAEELEKKIDPVEAALINPKLKATQDSLNWGLGVDGKLGEFAGVVESADAAPPAQAYEVFDSLSQRLAGPLAQAKDLLGKDLAAFNELARKDGLNALLLPPTGEAPAPNGAK